MIIWRGAGILGIIIPVVFIIASAFVFSKITHNSMDEGTRGGTPFLVGAIVSAVVLWLLGSWLNKPVSDSPFDPETGQPISGSQHTLFFIPLQFWAIIWLLFGLFKM